jgi:hypothetical protein
LADPALWEFRRAFLAALGQLPFDSVRQARTWLEFVEGAGKESAAQRERARLMVRLVIDFVEDALALSQGAPARRSDADDLPAAQALVSRLGTEGLLALLERCMEADAQIERYVSVSLVLEALLDTMGQRMAHSAQ